jgi:cysteine-rich repeat protein
VKQSFQKKIIWQFLPILILLAGSFLAASAALALDVGLNYGTATGLGTQDLRVTIMRIIQAILGFLGIIALVLVLYGGWVWMTAGGNAEKISLAKKILVNAAIGLVIIFSAFGIASFVINQLIVATGAGPGGSCDAAHAGQTDGCYRCNLVTPPSTYQWQIDLTISGCDPTAVHECHVASISPVSPPNRPLNSVIRVRFNYAGITNPDQIEVVNRATGNPVAVDRIVSGSLVELTPQAFCPAPQDTLHCFDANTQYDIRLSTGTLTCGSYALTCGGAGHNTCTNTFTTGDFLDTQPPTVDIIATQICQSTANNLQALVNDDYGIAYVNFNDGNFLNANDSEVSVPPADFASVNWDTHAYGMLPSITVTATAVDLDTHSTVDTQNFSIRADHCCNSLKDSDEVDADCGGADCEACVPVIEWVSPLDGAEGNLITIHGRHFNTASGQVLFTGVSGQPEVIASLASAANPACTDVWNDREIIVTIPTGAKDGAIKVVRADGLADQTDDNVGSRLGNFVINETVRPGLCTLNPTFGIIDTSVTFEGIRFAAGQSSVYFGAMLAGGTPVISAAEITNAKVPAFGTTNRDGIFVPLAQSINIGNRVKVNAEFSNPKSFRVDPESGPTAFECSSNANSCSVDQTKCSADHFCNSQCKCEPRQACDSDNSPAQCNSPTQAKCPAGWYCYDTTLHTPDSTKLPCYCYQTASCDNPTSSADADNPSCRPDNAKCPTGYVCDPQSNCTCQQTGGVLTESTYNWSFQTGKQPGACSTEAGVCKPDNTLCGINQICDPATCDCKQITAYTCTTDPTHQSCTPVQNCPQGQFCNDGCQCQPLIACDADGTNNICDPLQSMCSVGKCSTSGNVCRLNWGSCSQSGQPCSLTASPSTCPASETCQSDCPGTETCNSANLNYYCYNSKLGDAGYDPNKLSCYCYPGIVCDGNVATPACEPNQSICDPLGYACDNETCLCQPKLGIATESTFTWLFTTESFGPRVVENCNRTATCDFLSLASPTPFNRRGTEQAGYRVSYIRTDDSEVKIDATVKALFNSPMYLPSLTDATVKVYQCADPANCNTDVTNAFTIIAANNGWYNDQNTGQLTLVPNSLLAKNTYYKVDLDSAKIFGRNGVRLAANDIGLSHYAWLFKTKDSDELSTVGCVAVSPATAYLYYAGAIRDDYFAQPVSEDNYCVDIRPESCTAGWGWGTDKPAKVSVEQKAIANTAKATALGETINDAPNPFAKVEAECKLTPLPSVFGHGNLYIDFSSPYVIDHFPNCGTACLNAKIGATFSKAMDETAGFSVKDKMKLYICYDDPSCNLSAAEVVASFTNSVILDPAEAANTYTGYVPCYDFNNDGKDDYCLVPNTYYRVVIDSQVRSQNEHKPLAGLNFDQNNDLIKDSYSWIFKTQTDYGLCLPGKIDVAPAEKHADIGVNIFYAARPRTAPDSCDPVFGQRLNPYTWDFDWQSSQPTVADLVTPLRDGCGNGVIETGEDCDDGNLNNGDGCNNNCLDENDADLGNSNQFDVCGNGLIERTEECDSSGAGCSATCLYTGSVLGSSRCGDGQIGLGEECDGSELVLGGKPVDGDGCSSSCLIEDRSHGFCRSEKTNLFDFRLGECAGSGSCPANYDCLPLNSVPGNNNSGSVCGNGLVETGEECDLGGICSDNGDYCTTKSLYNCADPWTATCRPQNQFGCTDKCINAGSYLDTPLNNPPTVGPYQLVMTLADGETHIQSWLKNYTPATGGPLGQGHLTVGNFLPDGAFGLVEKWPDCNWACINAAIGGRFNKYADALTLNPDNIFLYDCGSDEICDIAGKTPIAITVTTRIIIPHSNPADSAPDTFDLSLPQTYNPIDNDQNPLTPMIPTLIPNTVYRVVVRNGVATADGKQQLDYLNFEDFTAPSYVAGTQNAYSWVFKTKPENNLCALDHVQVIPEKLTLPEGEIKYRYFSQPWSISDQCDARGQRLNPYSYDWRWDKRDLDGVTAANFVTPFKDGCGNGVVEKGEDCDPGWLSVPDCDSLTCKWAGKNTCLVATGSNCCGNSRIEPGEECEFNKTGLIGWYPLESNANDLINQNNGAGFGGLSFVGGKIGQGISFNGTTGYVEVNDNQNLQLAVRGFSLAFWVNGIDSAAGQLLLGKGAENGAESGFKIVSDSDKKIHLAIGDGSRMVNSAQVDLAISGWHFVAFTVNRDSGRGLKAYLDGRLVGETDPTSLRGGDISAVGKKLTFGGRQTGANLAGALDEIRIYSRALSPSEIMKLSTNYYCNERCLLIGNTNYNQEVCGNGIVETGEECDTGTEPNGDDTDGCTDICTFAGSIAGVNALCGDNLIGLGEECDNGDLARGGQPASGDGCTGINYSPAGTVNQVDCQRIDFSNLANCHTGLCYWTGNQCGTRPCLLENRNLNICRNVQTNVFDFTNGANPLSCPVGYEPRSLNGVIGNDNWGLSVCGNGFKETGEKCDDGGLCQNSADQWVGCTSLNYSQCKAGSGCTTYEGFCSADNNPCNSIGSPCGTGGQCISDGCSRNCTVNSSTVADNRLDPYQIVQTIDRLPTRLSQAREEILAWSALQPQTAGVGELTVVAGSEVPFYVIGHQPKINAANQCRNVAIWAVFSKTLKPSTILDSLKVCKNSCGTNPNLVKSYLYETVAGQCVRNSCVYPLADAGLLTNSRCQADNDCLGSRLTVTGLTSGFLESNATYQVDVSGVKDIISDADSLPQTGDYTSVWTFGTSEDFCQCDYVGVLVKPTSAGNLTINDLFACAGNFCGKNSPTNLLDDDFDYALAGNQHLYQAQCYDLTTIVGAITPISPSGVGFQWSEIDPANDQKGIIYLSDYADKVCSVDNSKKCNLDSECSGGICAVDNYNYQNLVTPGQDHDANGNLVAPPVTKGINGEAVVRVFGGQYRCSDTNEFCNPQLANQCAATAQCRLTSESSQDVNVTNFICNNPWPSLADVYRDNQGNCTSGICRDTHFKLYYCRDAGQENTTDDDLPALSVNPTVLGTRLGILKDFIFPVGESNQTPAGSKNGNEYSVGTSCPNPTPSPATLGNFSYCLGDGNNNLPVWSYNFAAVTAGDYSLEIKTHNFGNDLTSIAYCDENNDGILRAGEKTVCNPGAANACGTGTCLASVSQRLEIKVDNVAKGNIDNLASTASQTGTLFLGKLASGSHTVTITWRNDWSDPSLTPVPDSNLLIENLRLLKVEGAPTGDALGIRILSNPLHLSPKTWYQSGLCGGQGDFDQLCFKDTDCKNNNLFANGNFEQDTPATWSWNLQLSGNFAAGLTAVSDAGRTGRAARLAVTSGTTGWGQLRNDPVKSALTLSAGSYSYTAYVKSEAEVVVGAEKEVTAGNWQSLCDNTPNCLISGKTGAKCASGNTPATWQPVACNFTLTTPTKVQFYVRLRQAGSSTVDIDDLQLYGRCQMNVPTVGSPQEIKTDGYQAIRDGRTIYVGATNLDRGVSATTLYSNIYLLSYSQNASSQTQEIFNRLLDPTGQNGVWSFNTNVSNYRVCDDYGRYAETDFVCGPAAATGSIEIGTSNHSQCVTYQTISACEDKLKELGCFWSEVTNSCQAKICQPIYCANNFDCPNLSCDAEKEQVVRDSKRYADLREMQLVFKNYFPTKGRYPVLSAGSYISGTTFSVWPSWQQTLAAETGKALFIDPLNRFIGCTAYYCDSNGNGKIESDETTACVLGNLTACGNQPILCQPADPDQEKTCWDEISKTFACPQQMFVYAYGSANSGLDYGLYSNFEYTNPGTWATGQYPLPAACQRLNFEIHQTNLNPAANVVDCSAQGGDTDSDGVCDGIGSGIIAGKDNCPGRLCGNPANCYNPDQQDSNGNGTGNVCDTGCSGDSDYDGICDQQDNCPTVANRDQADSDSDHLGDVCDPCTDLDSDGFWDIDTGANDINVCPKDNCPPFTNYQTSGLATWISSDHNFYCKDANGKPAASKPCRSGGVNSSADRNCNDTGYCGNGFGDFASYNPYQEDYDNDNIGYICDQCLDFDKDGLGDYSFYTNTSTPVSTANLTLGQKEHFQGCQGNAGSFEEFDYAIANVSVNQTYQNPGALGGDHNFTVSIAGEYFVKVKTYNAVGFGTGADLASRIELDPTRFDAEKNYNGFKIQVEIDGQARSDKIINYPFDISHPQEGIISLGQLAAGSHAIKFNWLNDWCRCSTGCPVPGSFTVNCDANVGFVGFEIRPKITDLDNCPGGPYGPVCKDNFGIQISCSNSSQTDYNHNNIGDICDQPARCGDGLVIASEVCDAGDNASLVKRPWSTKNNERCNPTQSDDPNTLASCQWCANNCSKVVTETGGACGNGIIEKGPDDNQPWENCDCKSAVYRGTNPIDSTNPAGVCVGAASNGVPCNPAYNGSCQYCDNTCKIVTVGGLYCGNCQIDTGGGSAEECDYGTDNFGAECTANCKWQCTASNYTGHGGVTLANLSFPPAQTSTLTSPLCQISENKVKAHLNIRRSDAAPETAVVLVTDLSVSMNEACNGINSSEPQSCDPNLALLTALRMAVTNLLSNSDYNIKVGLVSFGLTYDAIGRTNSIVNSYNFSRNEGNLHGVINSYATIGGTNTSAAVIKATQMLTGSGSPNKIMIVMSDGEADTKLNYCESAIPNGCHTTAQTCNFGGWQLCWPCGEDRYDFSCSAVYPNNTPAIDSDADLAKNNGITIYSAAFGTVNEMNLLSSNTTLTPVPGCDNAHYCYLKPDDNSSNLPLLYTDIINKIKQALDVKFTVDISGTLTTPEQGLNFDYDSIRAGGASGADFTVDLNLPTNFCAAAAHGFAVRDLPAGVVVTFNSFEFNYCSSFPSVPPSCTPIPPPRVAAPTNLVQDSNGIKGIFSFLKTTIARLANFFNQPLSQPVKLAKETKPADFTVAMTPKILGSPTWIDQYCTASTAAPACTAGAKRDCSNQQGVCAGAKETCSILGQWPGCDYSTISGHYVSEAGHCLDGLDNDCDGQTDALDSDCAVTCTPNGCNGNCPAGCAASDDPDCGCQSGNSCCGLGCNNATDSDCPAAVEICNTPGDEDGNGFADCADFACKGQTGPAGSKCCWDGSFNSDADSAAYCNTCERCLAPADFGSALPNDYQCRPRVSDEGVGCTGSCSSCVVGGVCGARAVNDDTECTAACHVCSGTANDTCSILNHYTDEDTSGPGQCLPPNFCNASGSCVPPGADTAPDAFTFTDQTNVALSTVMTSNAITVSGINAPSPISITGGQYQVGAGSWTTAAGSINNGDTVKVRQTSAAAYSTQTNTVLIIGGVFDTFTSTTGVQPTFTLTVTPPTGSNSITSSDAPQTIDCGSTCSHAYPAGTSIVLTAYPAAGFIFTGWSGACAGTGVCNVTLDAVKTVAATFVAADTAPDAFTFTDQTNVALSTVMTSNAITVSGINAPAPISITGGQYQVGAGSWTTVAGSINNGDTVKVRQTSAAAYSTQTNTVLTIGGVSDTFTSTTGVQPTFTLTVTNPLAAGQVLILGGLINCGQGNTVCSQSNITSGTHINLTAIASTGYSFSSWVGGGCTTANPCDIVITGNTTVTANFSTLSTPLNIYKTGTGTGTVTSADTHLNCGSTCSYAYNYGDNVTLHAAAAIADSKFTGWYVTTFAGVPTGICAGTTNDCSLPMTTIGGLKVTANFNIDCNKSCANPVCAGQPGSGGTCCQNANDCSLPGVCAIATCSASKICQYTPDNNVCGSCGLCNGTTYACQSGGSCGSCATCSQQGNVYNCVVPSTDPCPKCQQCTALSGTNYQCNQITGFQPDTNGADQCRDDNVGCTGNSCVCDNSGVCVSCANADKDGLCDNMDFCPYDPDNDFDGDNICAVGCTSGSSHTGSKTNGWICGTGSTVTYDTCQGGSCNATNSCLAIFGAQDYFNVYINGRLVTGNLYLPTDPAYNPTAVPITPDQTLASQNQPNQSDSSKGGVLFNLNDYLLSGQNVIAIEAYHRMAPSTTREVRGAIANFLDSGLCTAISGPNRTLSSFGHSASDLPFPVTCWLIENSDISAEPLGIGDWKGVGFDDSSWGISYAAGATQQIFNRLYLPKYSNVGWQPRTIWAGPVTPGYTSSHTFCRYKFTH